MKSGWMASLALATGSLTAAGAWAQDLTMYTFYTTDVPYYEQIIDDYEAAHPGVTIHVEVFQNTAYDAALRTAFAGGDIPDIICVEPDARAVGMYPLIDANLLEPLNDLYEREGWDKSFYDNVLNQLDVDGTFYSVAVDVNSFQLFYNKAVLDKYDVEPPTSYADLKHMAEVMNPDDVYPIAFFNRFPQRGRDYFYMIAGQLDPEIVRKADSGEIPWTDPKLVEAAAKLKQMVDDGIFMPGINGMNADEQNQAWYVGRAAMVLSGPWDVVPYSNNKPDGFDLQVMRFPPVFDGVAEGVSSGGVGKNYAVPKGENTEAAKDFLAYLLSPEVMKGYVEANRIIAPYEGPNDGTDDPLLQVFIENQKTGLVPRVLLHADMLEALGGAIQGVLAGEITPEEAMQEVEDAR